MGLQTIPGTFRGFPEGNDIVNLYDGLFFPNPTNAFTSQHTPGNTLIDKLDSPGPSPMRQWELLSFGVKGYLTFVTNVPTYGKFGKIRVAVDTTDRVSVTNELGIFRYPNGPMLKFPENPALQATLWDPTTDSLPRSDSPGLFVSADVVLPIPVSVSASVVVGIWIEPALRGISVAAGTTASDVLILMNSSYLLNFDDGSN